MAMTFVEIVMLLHGFLATIALMAATLIMGVLLFSKQLSDRDVNLLKWISLGTFVAVFLLNLTGTYGYTIYRLKIPTSPRSIILASDKPWAHEVAFESMEYLSLIGPIIAAAVTYILWHYKADVVKKPAIKQALLVMLVVGILWGLALIGAGVIPTRIASVR